jgi:hypothetical protein
LRLNGRLPAPLSAFFSVCLLLLGMVLTTTGARATEPGRDISFAVIGDLPYSVPDEDNLRAVLEDIDNSDVGFVIHLGDIKSGSEYCGDELLQRRIALLNTSRKPLILALGDNEWTDCHRRSAGGFKPEERLAFLRNQLFAKPESLGHSKRAFEQQGRGSDQPSENLMFTEQGVLFVVLNIPGSNNNYWAQQEADHPQNAEFFRRKADTDAWLAKSMRRAAQADIRQVVIAFQGNPFENDSREQRSQDRDGYQEFRAALASSLKTLGKPTLIIHGDTHSHRIDNALRDTKGNALKNVTRLEGFGFPFTRNWVRVSAKTADNPTFQIQPQRLLQVPESGQ